MDTKDLINKTLFLLGAGASYDADCKLSSGMLKDLKRIINNDDEKVFIESEKEALKFLFSCLQYHGEWRTLETGGDFQFKPNIEELALLIRRVKNRENFLPYPLTGNWADKLVTLENDFKLSKSENKRGKTLFDSLDNKIKSELFPAWLEPNSLDFLDPLKDFFENYNQEDFILDIFSLNNDEVIEKYFEKHHSKPWRGFFSGEWRGFEEEEFPGEFGRLNLYKLHGSLDWFRLDTGEFKEKEHLEEIDKEHIDSHHSPYIIFGQGMKTFSIEPFFSLVHHFQKKLLQKDYFFIIGYSFFDPYINNLIFEAVKGTNKKIIIVNPTFGPYSSAKINETEKDRFSRIIFDDKVSNSSFSSYLEEIQKNSFYSERPEFNIKQINADALEYIPLGTKRFLKQFFSNKGTKFLDLIKEFEKDKQEDENPF